MSTPKQKKTQQSPSQKSDSIKSEQGTPIFMSYSYSSFSSVDKNGKQIQEEKLLQFESRNGKVDGKYQEKKDGKIIMNKTIKKQKDLKALL